MAVFATMTGYMQSFKFALGLYLLWTLLAIVSDALGQTMLGEHAPRVLLAGIAATNIMFLLVARASVFLQPPAATLAVAQCIFAITWITLYAFLSRGPGELLPGMYLTAVLFALVQANREIFVRVIGFSIACYLIVTLTKLALLPASAVPGAQALSVTAFLVISVALLAFAERLDAVKLDLSNRNANLQSLIKRLSRTVDREQPRHAFNRHFIMESLAREKGRSDRTNRSFSVVVLEPDAFDLTIESEGQIAAENIAQELGKRLRSAVRSMDGISPSPGRRLFGRVTADVYVIILPATNIDGAYRCAERVCAHVGEQRFLGGCRLTASAGIAEYRRNESVEDLLARAEAELAVAHRSGGNCVAGLEYREPFNADVTPLPARS